MTVFNSHSTADTESFAEKIGKIVTPGTCIAFFGGLGMGKTAFTRGLARGMGIDCHVSSPTFAIVNDYGGNPPLVHFDMYKVDSWDSLYSSGFFDYLDMGDMTIESISDTQLVLVGYSENVVEGQTIATTVKIYLTRQNFEWDYDAIP